MGDVALDSYRTWGFGFLRGITSTSSMSAEIGTTLDVLFLAVYLVFVWNLWREVGGHDG